jgi:hypothetical protein
MSTVLVAFCCTAFITVCLLAILIYSLCVVAGSEPPRQPRA